VHFAETIYDKINVAEICNVFAEVQTQNLKNNFLDKLIFFLIIISKNAFFERKSDDLS
jgi:hypothetical protein